MEDAFTSASITVVGPAGLATNCKFVQDLCWHSKRFKWLGKKPGQDMRSSENGLRLKKTEFQVSCACGFTATCHIYSAAVGFV